MNLLSLLGNVLLSEWIWGVMFGWAYVCSSLVFMTIFLKKLLPTSYLKAFFMAMGANVAAFSAYSIIIVGVFMYVLKWWYVPEIYDINTPFQAHLLLACIYTALHMLYFFLLYRVFRINIAKTLYAVTVSSLIATCVSYYYLRLTVGIIFIP